MLLKTPYSVILKLIRRNTALEATATVAWAEALAAMHNSSSRCAGGETLQGEALAAMRKLQTLQDEALAAPRTVLPPPRVYVS